MTSHIVPVCLLLLGLAGCAQAHKSICGVERPAGIAEAGSVAICCIGEAVSCTRSDDLKDAVTIEIDECGSVANCGCKVIATTPKALNQCLLAGGQFHICADIGTTCSERECTCKGGSC